MSDNSLVHKKCKSCESKGLPFNPDEISPYLAMVQGWVVTEGKVIEKVFASKNFVAAMAMAHKITEIAESENHHPDLHVSYRTLRVELTTHSVGGLTENDFIVAAKIDQIIG